MLNNLFGTFHALPVYPQNADHRVVRVVLDKANCIGFASSAIEDLLGHNYEAVGGMHISTLLPEFLIREDRVIPNKNRIRILRKISNRCTYAVHTQGNQIPVTVMLKNDDADTMNPPILLILVR